MKNILNNKKIKIFLFIALIMIIISGLILLRCKLITKENYTDYKNLTDVELKDDGNYYLVLSDSSKVQLSKDSNVNINKFYKDTKSGINEKDYYTFYTDIQTYDLKISFDEHSKNLKYKILNKRKEIDKLRSLDDGRLLCVYIADDYLTFKIPKTKTDVKAIYLNLDSKKVTIKKKDKNSIKVELKPGEDYTVKCKISKDKQQEVINLCYDITNKLYEIYRYKQIGSLGVETK